MPPALFLFAHHDFFHHIALANQINHFQPFVNLAKNRMVAVEVARRAARMADKKLRPTGIAAGMRHGEHSAVVVLVVAIEFAIYLIARTAVSNAVRTTALGDKAWNNPVESQAVIKSLPGKVNEIAHGIGGVFLKEFDLHDAFLGVDLCYLHVIYFRLQFSFLALLF